MGNLISKMSNLLISVSLMSVMVLKKLKNVKPVEVLVKQNLTVILSRVLLQSSLECYGSHYGDGKSFKNYKMLMKKIGGLCKARLKLVNLFFYLCLVQNHKIN